MRGLAVVLLMVVSACSFDATGPGGGGNNDATSAASSSGATDDPQGPTTTAPGTSTTDAVPDPTISTDLTTSTDPSSSSDPDTSTTAALPPGAYTVAATLATCVFLPEDEAPYAGPAVCNANAVAQNETALADLMMIDVEVANLDGDDRPAHAYLRFDVPAEFAALTVVDATLRLQIADGPDDIPNSEQSGELVRTAAFDAVTLETGAPAVVEPLHDDLGDTATDQEVTWSLRADLVVPGQPLFLGLLPTRNDGVLYRGTTAPGAPTLELVLQ